MTKIDKKLTADDVQVVENVLDDGRASGFSRRAFLGTAAATAAGAAAVAFPGFARAQSTGSAQEIGTAAVTAEALAVTYLTGVIQNVGSEFPRKVQNILKAANAAEQAHYEFLQGAGFKPLTTRFWVPDVAFDPAAIPAVIEYFECAFVNAYLIATTAFANTGRDADLARYTVEIGAVEAEHLALARSLQNELPNDRAFQAYNVDSISEIVAQIGAAGVGLGEEGAAPGQFYEYRQPPGSAVVELESTEVA